MELQKRQAYSSYILCKLRADFSMNFTDPPVSDCESWADFGLQEILVCGARTLAPW